MLVVECSEPVSQLSKMIITLLNQYGQINNANIECPIMAVVRLLKLKTLNGESFHGDNRNRNRLKFKSIIRAAL